MSFVALGDVALVAQLRSQTQSISERPEGQRMAMLKLRRGNEIAKEALAIGRKVGWPEPSKADWRKLFDDGICKREPADNGFIVLTSYGLMQQRILAETMCKLAGLHLLAPHGGDRFNVIARCTCGWHVHLSKNQGHVISGQFSHFGVHLDAVAKGIWKRPRSVEEIVNETIARQTAPMVPGQTPAKETEHVDA